MEALSVPEILRCMMACAKNYQISQLAVQDALKVIGVTGLVAQSVVVPAVLSSGLELLHVPLSGTLILRSVGTLCLRVEPRSKCRNVVPSRVLTTVFAVLGPFGLTVKQTMLMTCNVVLEQRIDTAPAFRPNSAARNALLTVNRCRASFQVAQPTVRFPSGDHFLNAQRPAGSVSL